MGRRRKGFAWNGPQPKDEGPRDLKALKVRPKTEFIEAELRELQRKAEAFLGPAAGVSANLLYGFGHIIVQSHDLPPSLLTTTSWRPVGLLPLSHPEGSSDDGR
jgi:hypothetical protein